MRQRRWLELVKDYDCETHYHPRKVNVVDDALSKTIGDLEMLIAQRPLWRKFERLSLEVVTTPSNSVARIVILLVQPNLCDRIKSYQRCDQFFEFIKAEIDTENQYQIKSYQRCDQFFEFIKAEIDTEKWKDFDVAEDKALSYP
ncbi:RNA-directed DNA polymerase [Abeliophyllum distichum]|uniref:RNA-directed DNA polymerase n=1 Tax=Abeliophyllum distichum TaxID=126358 RepID=A0ABD1QGY0_9LAMI